MKTSTMIVVVVLFVVFPWVFLFGFINGIPFSPDDSTESIDALPENSQNRITSIIENIAPDASVLLSDSDFNVGTSAKAPYEVIVNTTASDCFDAKMKLLEIMRTLYMDDIGQKSISRVLVNMPNYLSASVGINAGRSMTPEGWGNTGPTNFFKTLHQLGTGDIDGVSLSDMTWAQGVGSCR